MRLAVLSDLHGNLPALEAVLEDLLRHAVDGLIVAGDLIGGPQPIESIQLVLSHDPLMISGNSDTNLLRYRAGLAPKEWNDRLQFALLRWSDKHLDDRTIELLLSLPEQRSIQIPGTAAIRVVHGSPRDQSESIFPTLKPISLKNALSQIEEPVLVCGHTHIPWKVECHGKLALNPGAVCGPLNGEVCAQYAILTWAEDKWLVEHFAVEYDLDRIRRAFRGSGLIDEGGALARAFLRSIETGQNLADWFLNHAYRLAKEAGFGEIGVIPDHIWELADGTFNWEATSQPGTT